MGSVDLERAARTAGLAAPVRWDEVTGSTNATAAAMAREGAPEWTLVGAGHQTAGRGRRDRTWQDRPGGALMVSVVLRPALEPVDAGLLSLLAGAAWAEAIEGVGGPTVRCKWPNDLMAGDDKVGGILAESLVEGDRLASVVIGSGINLVAARGARRRCRGRRRRGRDGAPGRLPRGVRRRLPAGGDPGSPTT